MSLESTPQMASSPSTPAASSSLSQQLRHNHLSENGSDHDSGDLINRLQGLRLLQENLDLYDRRIDQSLRTKSYRRKTNLGHTDKDPLDEIDKSEESRDLDNKMTEVQKIDDAEIKSQFIAGFEATQNNRAELTLNIFADIQRLCRIYLEALTHMKVSLPSVNIENLHFKKHISQYSIPANRLNNMELIMGELPANARQSVQTNGRGSLHSTALGSVASNNSVRSSTVAQSKIFADQYNAQKLTTVKTVDCPKTPQVILIDQKQTKETELWKDLIFELQTNPSVLTDFFGEVMKNGFVKNLPQEESKDDDMLDGGFDIQHTTMIVNMAQFFFDSVHKEERMAFHQTSHFMQFFYEFTRVHLTTDKFGFDYLGNICIKDEALLKVILCLFEGMTRKIPAFNYLKFVFAGPFQRINLQQMEQDFIRLNNPRLDRSQSEMSLSTISMQPEPSKKEAPKDKKEEKGFFDSIKNFFKSNDDKKKKQKEQDEQKNKKKNNNKDAVPVEMAFDDGDQTAPPDRSLMNQSAVGSTISTNHDSLNSSRSSSRNQPIIYQSMTAVYGGEKSPFSVPPDIRDEPAILKRFEEVEKKIQENQVNNHKFVMDDFQKTMREKTTQADLISKTESSVRDFCKTKMGNQPLNANEASESGRARDRDLTYYIKTLVQKNFEQMLNFSQKIPLDVRAMLKIIVMRYRGGDLGTKIRLNTNEIRLLASIIIASWINMGYRNPKCFGIQSSVEKELELEYIFFQAARITFEHTMLMQKIPEDVLLECFNVQELNEFIMSISSHVFVFWIRLLNVDITEIAKEPDPQYMRSNIIRLDDLEMMYIYCRNLRAKVMADSDNNPSAKWQKFNSFVGQLDALIEPHWKKFEQLDKQEETLIPRNKLYGVTIQDHFHSILDLRWEENFHEYEWYALVLRQKTKENAEVELQEGRAKQSSETDKLCQSFIEELTLESKFAPPPIPSLQKLQSDILPDIMAQRNASFKKERPNSIVMRQLAHRSQKLGLTALQKVNKMADVAPQLVEQVRINAHSQEFIPKKKVHAILLNILSSLKAVLSRPLFQIECLRELTENQNKDLVEIMTKAQKVNDLRAKPDVQIKIGTKHIITAIRQLHIDGDIELQYKILSLFTSIIQSSVAKHKQYLESVIIDIDSLTQDVVRFEQNITSLKQFNTRYENNQTFMKTISRYNPEVCFLECFSLMLQDEWRHNQGLLLNLSCSRHQTNLPMSSYMLFGVISRRANGPPQQIAQEEQVTVVSQDDLEKRSVKDKRMKRFQQVNFFHTQFTVQLQNSQEGIKLRDEPIKLIEYFIKYYCKDQRYNLRTLISANEEKYKHISWQDGQPVTLESMRTKEPLDYMNLVRTYEMFLQHISVLSSTSIDDSYIEENDKEFYIKQHYDFLNYDLPAKALRYQVHDYIMKRLHSVVFRQQSVTQMDERVQRLILEKHNDPDWVLTSPESQRKFAAGEKVDDFTDTPEWCDPYIYSASLKTLLRVTDEETPHMKAIYIDDAVVQAIQAMKISTPFKPTDSFGEPLRARVMKHLLLELCKIYDRARTNPRLYSQLLWIVLFNVPQNEDIYRALIAKQHQNFTYQNDERGRDFNKLKFEDRHQMYLEVFANRYKVGEWFDLIRGLIMEENSRKASQKQMV